MTALITQRIYHHKPYNELWECLDVALYEYLLKCDCRGFGVSSSQKDYIAELFSDKEVLVLSGGNDIGQYPKRDEFEFTLLEYALQHNKKILAICRGMQIVATYFGLKLHKSTHAIKEYHALSGTLTHSVHSYHHFCIKEVPSGFENLAYVDDEIEAMKSKQILALMWHPEREKQDSTLQADRALVSQFLQS